MGEELRWGGNDIGRRGLAHVVADGAGEDPCSFCGREESDYYVHVENDRITRVDVATDVFDFGVQDNFVVIRP